MPGPSHAASPQSVGGTLRAAARILIVEDEPINVRIIQKFLAGAGYRHFLSADSGERALELIAAGMPDLILLDIFLNGGISGLEMLERLRAIPAGQRVPVLVLTASDDQAIRRRACDLGACGILSKPFKSQDLIAWVGRCLEEG